MFWCLIAQSKKSNRKYGISMNNTNYDRQHPMLTTINKTTMYKSNDKNNNENKKKTTTNRKCNYNNKNNKNKTTKTKTKKTTPTNNNNRPIFPCEPFCSVLKLARSSETVNNAQVNNSIDKQSMSYCLMKIQ